MLRQDFQRLSNARVREARALARAGLYDGAYYLGGLAIECALKACIARSTKRYEFPDRDRTRNAYSHDLEQLLKEAGLVPRLSEAGPDTQVAWSGIKAWSVETRYRMGKSRADVLDFLRAATGRGGVLRWLRQFW